ncbi:MAG TPA: VOC family protein [Polyangiaceae bacterium]|nr:VOC family protein [Polyangiaceae bacterium]
MPVPTLLRAILFAKDVKRLTEFYHEALGLPLAAQPSDPNWVELDAGGVRLAIHALPPRVAREVQVTWPPRAREEVPLKLVFEVDDLEQTRRHLTSRGATMFEPRTSAGFQVEACDGLDPEGNVFRLVAARPGRA